MDRAKKIGERLLFVQRQICNQFAKTSVLLLKSVQSTYVGGHEPAVDLFPSKELGLAVPHFAAYLLDRGVAFGLLQGKSDLLFRKSGLLHGQAPQGSLAGKLSFNQV